MNTNHAHIPEKFQPNWENLEEYPCKDPHWEEHDQWQGENEHMKELDQKYFNEVIQVHKDFDGLPLYPEVETFKILEDMSEAAPVEPRKKFFDDDFPEYTFTQEFHE